MPRAMRRPSTPTFSEIEIPGHASGEIVYDTAFVARTLDRVMAGRLQDLETLRNIAAGSPGQDGDALHRQLLLLARSAREAFDTLQQSREILVGLHRDATGGEVVASVDGSTSLPNRQAFSTHLCQVLKRLEPARPLSLLVIEIGALQILANEMGSAVANRILKRFATILRRTVKRSDIVARISPQHFAVVFEDILPEKAVNIALRIHQTIEAKLSPKGDRVAGVLSMTMGVASTSGPGLTAEQLLQKAHDAVTQARKEGRPAIHVA